MSSDGDKTKIKDALNGLNYTTALGAWTWRWMHWYGSVANLRSSNTFYIYMPFIECADECGYLSWLSAVINSYYVVLEDALPDSGLSDIFWAQRYYPDYSFGSLCHGTNEVTVERRHRLRGSEAAPFFDGHEWGMMQFHTGTSLRSTYMGLLGWLNISLSGYCTYRHFQSLRTILDSHYEHPGLSYWWVSRYQNPADQLRSRFSFLRYLARRSLCNGLSLVHWI